MFRVHQIHKRNHLKSKECSDSWNLRGIKQREMQQVYNHNMPWAQLWYSGARLKAEHVKPLTSLSTQKTQAARSTSVYLKLVPFFWKQSESEFSTPASLIRRLHAVINNLHYITRSICIILLCYHFTLSVDSVSTSNHGNAFFILSFMIVAQRKWVHESQDRLS